MKQVGLLPSPWSCSAFGPIEWWKAVRESVKGGQRIRASSSGTLRVDSPIYWRADHAGIICLPAIPYTPHTPLFFSLFPSSKTHTHACTYTLQKSNWKNWGLWKWAKPVLLEAPMPQCILKHHSVTDAVPSWEGLAEAQTLLGTLFQMTTKRKKVSVESVGPAVFFTPDECGSLGADTLCVSVGPGYGPVPEHWSTILLSVQ